MKNDQKEALEHEEARNLPVGNFRPIFKYFGL